MANINLTLEIRKIIPSFSFTSGDVIHTNMFIYRATPNKVCIAHSPDKEDGHPYGRKWYTWNYFLNNSALSSDVRMRINNLFKDVISPVSPLTEKVVSKNTGVIQTLKSVSPKSLNKASAEPKGCWKVTGNEAISPKGRTWKVIHATENGWVIESKSGISAFITKNGSYRSL